MRHYALVLILLAGCPKEQPKADPTAASASVAASAPASASASVAASATEAATASATASVAATAPGSGTVAIKKPGGGELPGAEGSNAKGGHWEIVVPAPHTCDTGSECPVIVRLTALEGFHVNKDYPTKLTLDDAPNVEMLGKDAKGKNIYSKSAGDFTIDGEKIGTMNAKVKPTAAGLAKIGGTLKFSVCSEANCQMETAQVKATIPVR